MQHLKGTPEDQFPSEPRDTYRIAYIIHFFLGAGNLLPWNVFITAVDYFGYLYPTGHVEKVFSVAYMSTSVMVLVMVMSFGGWSPKFSHRLRMNLGLIMFIVSLMMAPIMDWIWTGTSGGAYGVTVGTVVICGLADGLIGGSLIGSAGKLPKEYMQAVFAGTASSGTSLTLNLYFSSRISHFPPLRWFVIGDRCSCFHLEDYNKGISPSESSGRPDKRPLLFHLQLCYNAMLLSRLQLVVQVTSHATPLQQSPSRQ